MKKKKKQALFCAYTYIKLAQTTVGTTEAFSVMELKSERYEQNLFFNPNMCLIGILDSISSQGFISIY